MVASLGNVVIVERLGLFVVDIQSFPDGVDVVVAASACLPAFEHSVDEFLLVYFEAYDRMDLRAILVQELLKGLGL